MAPRLKAQIGGERNTPTASEGAEEEPAGWEPPRGAKPGQPAASALRQAATRRVPEATTPCRSAPMEAGSEAGTDQSRERVSRGPALAAQVANGGMSCGANVPAARLLAG